MTSGITVDSSKYCFLDLDFNNHRDKLATAAAFVDATDSRYGFSSKDLRLLGGSEISRIRDLISTDHEWSNKATRGIATKPPVGGNRIVLELYWDVAPLACENFATLCANGSIVPGSNETKAKPVPVGSSGKPLTYRNSTMHRCIPGFVLQGGDFVLGNGSGGESIFNSGKKFKDERAGLQLKHDRPYVLSMGNSGKNANSSQFFITFKAAPQCDGKHVVFGRVVSGFDVINAAEGLGTASGEPTAPIVITDCGVFEPLQTPGAGYWYDTPDADSFSGKSPVFMVLPRDAVVSPTAAVSEKFEKALGDATIVTSVVQSGEDDDEETALLAKLDELLGTFSVDVIIVAPVLKALVPKILFPSFWEAAGISVDNACFASKPVDSLATVRQSWLSSKDWRLEGT